jgi:hypothetical protein
MDRHILMLYALVLALLVTSIFQELRITHIVETQVSQGEINKNILTALEHQKEINDHYYEAINHLSRR